MDIAKLVEDLNHEIRSNNKACFSERIYRDEPILRTAASLATAEPSEYRLMRKLGVTYDRTFHTESRIFYEQAKFMEWFEDHFEDKANFTSFFPTYRVMSIRQQRTYFTWRTKIRNGIITPIDISYVYVYLYELLNMIGVQSPEEAFHAISNFIDAYSIYDPEPKRYASIWLHDLVVYYGLPAELLNDTLQNEIYASFETISDPGAYTDDQLFSAMQSISTYTIDNSRFYRTYPSDFVKVCTAVYREMTTFFENNRKTSFYETMIGRQRAFPYEMFSCAVFYDKRRFEERCYQFNAMDRYACVAGKWVHYSPAGGETKSKQVGAFLRNIDAIMREEYQFPFELKRQNPTKLLVQTALEQIRRLQENKSAAERKIVTIDFSALEQIRAASEATKERILTQEERNDEPFPLLENELPTGSHIETESLPPPETESSYSLLTEDESKLLLLLLRGEDPAPVFKEKGMLLSVVADGINERLFDMFGDSVIEFTGDSPFIIEDYRSELQNLIE